MELDWTNTKSAAYSFRAVDGTVKLDSSANGAYTDFVPSGYFYIHGAWFHVTGGGTCKFDGGANGRIYADAGTVEIDAGVTLEVPNANVWLRDSTTFEVHFWGHGTSCGLLKASSITIQAGTGTIKVVNDQVQLDPMQQWTFMQLESPLATINVVSYFFTETVPPGSQIDRTNTWYWFLQS
jgi:hypothetical protein